MTDRDHVTEARPLSLSYWAVISAIAAVAALFTPIIGLRLALAMVAVVAGHAALHEIRAGLKSGKGFAGGGLGVGYLAIVLSIVVLVAGD